MTEKEKVAKLERFLIDADVDWENDSMEEIATFLVEHSKELLAILA